MAFYNDFPNRIHKGANALLFHLGVVGVCVGGSNLMFDMELFAEHQDDREPMVFLTNPSPVAGDAKLMHGTKMTADRVKSVLEAKLGLGVTVTWEPIENQSDSVLALAVTVHDELSKEMAA